MLHINVFTGLVDNTTYVEKSSIKSFVAQEGATLPTN